MRLPPGCPYTSWVQPLRLFHKLSEGRFLERPNRFVVRCEVKGRDVSAFLPNPGRLQELLLPGRTMLLTETGPSADRKYRYTAVAVLREGHPIMLHTHRTNDVAQHLLKQRLVPGLEGAEIVRREVSVGRSRFDFLLRQDGNPLYLEVKSCTLVGKELAMFPDAVTARGARHLEELATLADQGHQCAVLFVVHWPFATLFMPDYHTDPVFTATLLTVREKVRIIPVAVGWGPDLTLSGKPRLLAIPWDRVALEAKDRGSYLILMELKKERVIHTGSLGPVLFHPGHYAYVGSAMANLTKRIERHRRLTKKPHWHIDYLRPFVAWKAALAIRSSTRLECDIARAVATLADRAVPSFGSSDCSCSSHLFSMDRDPLRNPRFQEMLQYFKMDRLTE